MPNVDSSQVSAPRQAPKSCALSVILSTQSDTVPSCIQPQHIRDLIPQGISSEIIVVHYDQNYVTGSGLMLDEARDNGKNTKLIKYAQTSGNDGIIHAKIRGKHTYSFMRGVEISNGQFIFAVDGDMPYPDRIITRAINELVNSPETVIIASKYVDGSSTKKLPFMRTMISKAARTIVKHGLKVQDVKDPLSGCFAISRHLLENIKIEGKGDELLLEILVKLNRNRKYDRIPVKEIPFEQKSMEGSKKLDLERMVSYSRAVWHLYRYGRKSERLQRDPDYAEQKKHKSILFLSKAARFFTVGASGLVVNYAVSLLLSSAVSSIWYIHATLFGIVASITTNFILNKIWTFEDTDFSLRRVLKQYVLFLILCSVGAVVQLSLVFAFVEYSHIQYGISLLMAVAIASLGNFLLNKKITFGEKIWE